MNMTFNLTPEKRFGKESLALVILSIAQYATREFLTDEDSDPYFRESAIHGAAHCIACMIAQHAPQGDAGVETQDVKNWLALDKLMPDEDRLTRVNYILAVYW